MGVTTRIDEVNYLKDTVLALCDIVMTLANESYASGVLDLETHQEEARRRCNEALLDGMARVIVARMLVQNLLSRRFDQESLVQHVKDQIESKVDEWMAGFPEGPLGNDSTFRPVWGLKVRHRQTKEQGRALAFEDERVVVEWAGSPPRRELCSVDDIECA